MSFRLRDNSSRICKYRKQKCIWYGIKISLCLYKNVTVNYMYNMSPKFVVKSFPYTNIKIIMSLQSYLNFESFSWCLLVKFFSLLIGYLQFPHTCRLELHWWLPARKWVAKTQNTETYKQKSSYTLLSASSSLRQVTHEQLSGM